MGRLVHCPPSGFLLQGFSNLYAVVGYAFLRPRMGRRGSHFVQTAYNFLSRLELLFARTPPLAYRLQFLAVRLFQCAKRSSKSLDRFRCCALVSGVVLGKRDLLLAKAHLAFLSIFGGRVRARRAVSILLMELNFLLGVSPPRLLAAHVFFHIRMLLVAYRTN